MIFTEKDEVQEHAKRLNKRLRRYGYKIPEDVEEIEVHGPHLGMNYQVWLVYVVSLTNPKEDFGNVAIYPRQIFWTENYEWNEAPYHEEERLSLLK